MTVAEFAVKKRVPLQTVYSWIYRNQTEVNGFKVLQFGKIKMIKEVKLKKKVA
jgi:hypothetical protein